MNLPEQKQVIRLDVRQRIKALSKEDRSRASSAICRRIKEAIRGIDGLVFAFISMPSEVSLHSFLLERIPLGVAVPVVDWTDDSMYPCRLNGLDAEDLSPDRHGLSIPSRTERIDLDLIEAIIVPAMAFDEFGHRLGRGGGFYDRFLDEIPPSVPRIGVAFDEQILEHVPVESWDQRMTLVITPTRTMTMNER